LIANWINRIFKNDVFSGLSSFWSEWFTPDGTSGVTPIKAGGHSALPEFFQNGNALPEI